MAAEHDRQSLPASVRTMPRPGTANHAPLDPPAEGLESRLRHCYVSGFKALSPLAEAAAQLAAKIRVGERRTLTARVRHAADASVHLNFSASLPVWTLLEMMALQTGATMELSGQSVVFSRAKKPVPVEGLLSRTARLAALRSLLAVAAKEEHTDELIVFETLIREALGSDLLFEEPSKTSAHYHGTPRDVQVLSLALNAISDQPAMMSLVVELVSIPLPGSGGRGIDTTGLNGILSPAQIQEKLLPLRTASGVRSSVHYTAIAEPGDETIVSVRLPNGSRPELPASLDAKFRVAPSDLKFCKLYSEINIEQPAEEDPAVIATQQGSTTTNLYFGQTLALGSFKQDDTREVMIFVTPTGAGTVTASAAR